jgi:hypothetical protein
MTMATFPKLALAAAFATAMIATPAAAQTDDQSSVQERPILIFGAVAQNEDHSSVQERPILIFGAMTQNEDQSSVQERPILIFGAIKDRNAAPQAADPADLALPEMPVVYEEDTPAPGPTRR